jgi:riboflavin synthase
VRGVVEGLGRVEKRRQDGDATLITYCAPEHVLDSVIERGPICVDGVSLTVVAKDERTFAVSIVGFTGAHTTLLDKAVGDPVNLESDIMMRYVAQAVKSQGPRASQAPGRLPS